MPYSFRIEDKGVSRRIFTTFRDGFHQIKEIEISEKEHDELVGINRSVRNIEASEENHNEFIWLTEEEHAERGASTAPSAEDEALNNLLIEQVKSAFMKLPPAQARRYLLAHGLGFSYAEIARMEGCSVNTVKKSLVAAKKKLQEILRIGVPETPSKFGSY
jgi:RNA polymerase sigma-70 factor (ECF subfamily)